MATLRPAVCFTRALRRWPSPAGHEVCPVKRTRTLHTTPRPHLHASRQQAAASEDGDSTPAPAKTSSSTPKKTQTPSTTAERQGRPRRDQFESDEEYVASRKAFDTARAKASSFIAGPMLDLASSEEQQEKQANVMAYPDESRLKWLRSVEPKIEKEPPEQMGGFFSMEEENDDPGEDYEFEPDDISTTAHGELEQVRELRELERIIAWDMPLLYQHAKPFAAPTAAQPLKWRYTTFLGETHPASRKVVLVFNPHALPDLTPQQKTKLTKLLGATYNSDKGIAKMSSDRHPSALQNKRALGEQLERMLVEARDPTDMFEDIPLDTRHTRIKNPKGRLRFPEAWKVTEERAARLREGWEERRQKEAARIESGEVMEGAEFIGGEVLEEEFAVTRPRVRRR